MGLMRKLFRSRAWLKAKLCSLLCLPVVLIALPANFFDEGPPMCLSVLLLDEECYGCGMTRACQHLIHLDFAAAYHLNPISIVVFPILCGLLMSDAWRTYRRILVTPKA